MTNPFQKKQSKLDEPIDRILREMETFGPDSTEYEKLLPKLEKLYALQTEESKRGVTPDALVSAAANLLGILTIVSYEQKHVMVSKAMAMLQRNRTV